MEEIYLTVEDAYRENLYRMRLACMSRNEMIECGKYGKRVHTNSFTLIYIHSEQIKMTISISKSFGKAHDRNKAKRRIYNSIHGSIGNVHIWFKLHAKHRPYSTFDQISTNIKYIKKRLQIK